VRDHQDRAGIMLEIILEPAERLEIEMVRRLVEHEQVRLHHQQPRQVRAHDPAAAHRLRRAVKIGFAEGEPAQDALRLRFKLVSPSSAKRPCASWYSSVSVCPFARLRKDALQLGVLRRDGGGQFEHGFVAGRGRFLRQVTERRVAVDDHRPVVGFRRAEDDREQRRLARAVRPDQRDALARD
jgi:hypothetical protein